MATILSTDGATLFPGAPEAPADTPDLEADTQPEEQAQPEPGAEDGALHADSMDANRSPEQELSDGQRIIATRWKAVSDILGQAFAGCRNEVFGSKGEPGLLKTADRRDFGRKVQQNYVALADMQREISLVLCGARDYEIGARMVAAPAPSIVIPGQG